MDLQTKPYKPILDVEGLAELLNRSKKTIYRMIENNELKGTYRMLGKSYMFSLRKVIEYIERGDDDDSMDTEPDREDKSI